MVTSMPHVASETSINFYHVQYHARVLRKLLDRGFVMTAVCVDQSNRSYLGWCIDVTITYTSADDEGYLVQYLNENCMNDLIDL